MPLDLCTLISNCGKTPAMLVDCVASRHAVGVVIGPIPAKYSENRPERLEQIRNGERLSQEPGRHYRAASAGHVLLVISAAKNHLDFLINRNNPLKYFDSIKSRHRQVQ